ncbi:hypothetical protein [Burkholderia ubonensis]|uniref:hypothetical protein n=1 Tax=Burkholderia ubonensis TaxID=101571 RepID=UPI0012FC8747|nr:hypothetical protein [Burkholderia ubonensis]
MASFDKGNRKDLFRNVTGDNPACRRLSGLVGRCAACTEAAKANGVREFPLNGRFGKENGCFVKRYIDSMNQD